MNLGLSLLLALVALVPVTAQLAWVDLREYRLPNQLTATAFGIALLGTSMNALLQSDWSRATSGYLCSITSLIAFLILHLISRTALGLGDVKLAPSLGMVLGYLGGPAVINALLACCLAAGLVSGVLLAMRRLTLRSRVPFGPFMIFGFWFSVILAL